MTDRGYHHLRFTFPSHPNSDQPHNLSTLGHWDFIFVACPLGVRT
jgi:hypothetical protein